MPAEGLEPPKISRRFTKPLQLPLCDTGKYIIYYLALCAGAAPATSVRQTDVLAGRRTEDFGASDEDRTRLTR